MIDDEWQMEKPVKELAAKHGYTIRREANHVGEIIFIRVGVQVTVWLRRMTVRSSLTHPKKGQTQLYRRHVDLKTLEQIFRNPRQHTGAGYYTRR